MTATMPAMLQSHHRTLSNLSTTEDLFSSITGLDDLAGDDDLSFDDIEDSLDGSSKAGSGNGPAKKGKSRTASTAEKKATHNAVERARRESLNARFLVLADMLPGMTQVKRASKAAIVNKSIDLITELQRTEMKLAKENEALKAELEALRARTGSPTGTSATSASSASSANAAAAAANAAALAAAQEAAAAAVARQASFHQHSLYAGMHQHPMQLGMPGMMPHLPAAAMASIAAAAAGNPVLQQYHHQQQQHQQAQPPTMHAAAPQNGATSSATPSAEMGSHLFPGIFSGLFNAGGAFDSPDHARSESGSPASHGSQGSTTAASSAYTHGLFDMPAVAASYPTLDSNKANSTGSPNSLAGYNTSPLGTVASLAGSEGTNQSQGTSLTQSGSAPSPASSNGVPTPQSNNAYSPLGLSAITATPPTSSAPAPSVSAIGLNVDPVIAAFDATSDPAYLASQFAPNDLAKAQHDLQAFIAYHSQQRLSAAQLQQQQQQQPHTPTLEHGQRQGSAQMSPSIFPTPSSAGGQHGSFAQQQQQHLQQQHQQAAAFPGIAAGMCGSSAAQASMNGLPAWQMMMAQHQAMVAAHGSQHGHF